MISVITQISIAKYPKKLGYNIYITDQRLVQEGRPKKISLLLLMMGLVTVAFFLLTKVADCVCTEGRHTIIHKLS